MRQHDGQQHEATMRLTGKPMANTDSCGAARLRMPMARLMVSRAQISGSASSRPETKDGRAPFGQDAPAVAVQHADRDRQRIEAAHQRAEHQQVAVQRQEDQHRDDIEQPREHRGVGAGGGSKNDANDRPICRPTNSPAVCTAANTTRMGQSQRDADEYLLAQQEQPGVRTGRDGRHGADRRRHGDRQHEGQGRSSRAWVWWTRKTAARRRPGPGCARTATGTGQPAVELFHGERNHGAARPGAFRTPASGSGRSAGGCSRSAGPAAKGPAAPGCRTWPAAWG
ncbi:Uncharacterised protein [Bordetella pertussis]|nr:Uncharacterised protein [Bordetella pertussis]